MLTSIAELHCHFGYYSLDHITMVAPNDGGAAFFAAYKPPPPPGAPYSVPLPGSQKEGRSAVYRHWRFADKELPDSCDPQALTAHSSFEASVKRNPKAKCLGERPYNPATKTHGNYEWMTYGEVAARRKNFGAGLVELHKKAGVTEEKYGVGLWCQNRPEWQIVGMLHSMRAKGP